MQIRNEFTIYLVIFLTKITIERTQKYSQNKYCWNNGTCTDLVNDYNCDCIPGFNGINCDSNKHYLCKLSSLIFAQKNKNSFQNFSLVKWLNAFFIYRLQSYNSECQFQNIDISCQTTTSLTLSISLIINDFVLKYYKPLHFLFLFLSLFYSYSLIFFLSSVIFLYFAKLIPC